MAFDFLKRVFTFDQVPPETPAAPPADAPPMDESAPDAVTPAEVTPPAPAPVGEDIEAFGPHLAADAAPDDALPLAKDPVLAEEMATAGGPSSDSEAEAEDAEETLLPLPPAENIGDLGVVPLSLLEAEAELPPGESLTESPTAGLERPRDIAALPAGFATGPAPEPEVAPEAERLTWFQRLRAGLSRTSSQLTGQITALFTKRKLDDATLEELEDLLIQADLGVETALRITDTLASERYGRDVSGADVWRIMAAEITKVLTPVAKPLQLDLNHRPHVILVVGVNGTGKTTTIGKLAAKLSGAGLKVMLAAGDTFRAAAIEQLKIWADRTNSHIVSSKLGADAAGLAYEAFEEARRQKSDVLIIDTAGRLQNRTELMAELEKIVRVLGKLDPDAPHTVLQTLDATTGQNALNQVEIFRNVAGVNGLIMTKLDGTARGGILVAISAKHKLPVYFIGVGEGIADLEPFEAQDFAEAIAGIAD